MTPKELNELRIFPRITLVITIALWWQISDYMLFSIPMDEQKEWIFVQYGVVCAPFVAFATSYMNTGNKQ